MYNRLIAKEFKFNRNTQVYSAHNVNRCECDIRELHYFMFVLNLLNLILFRMSQIVQCIVTYKKKKKIETTLEAKILEGQRSYHDADFDTLCINQF